MLTPEVYKRLFGCQPCFDVCDQLKKFDCCTTSQVLLK